MAQILSSEIVSLVHHVKLNESGWLEKAVQSIIISTFGISHNSPLREAELLSQINKELNSSFDNSRIWKQLEILKHRQIVQSIQDEFYILSEDAFESFKKSFAIQKEIEFEAERRFADLCNSICPDLDSKLLWSDLNSRLIIPLIQEIGAKTYELISGEGSIRLDQYTQFVSFLSRYTSNREKLQVLLLNYFDFKNVHVKKYVLHQLNAYFFIEATNLNQQTVEKVYSLSKSQTDLKIYVDTNFLLTLLDLHDNPSNDAALLLLALLDEIKNRVKVKFYVLPITALEFQNLIRKFKDYLNRIRPTLNQAVAAESSDDFSGIIKKYFQKCLESKTMLNIDDYFDPYLENFTVNIRAKGLEIEQVNMAKYSTDQRVIDDLLEQVNYRFEKMYNQGRFNGLADFELQERRDLIYSKFNHDCQIWYYLKDKRPVYIDSPKDIKNWILTLDFSFLEFDKFKQYNAVSNKISLCLHPNEFISMLQFWVPRTAKFEDAILGNFRLPFLFKEIDNEAERVSLEILRAMSQYEDSEKFSSELVTEILTNKAIRQKIKVQNSVEQNALLIKEELFKNYEVTQRELKDEKAQNENITGELHHVKSQLAELHMKLDSLQEATNRKIEKELELIRRSRIQELENQREKLKLEQSYLDTIIGNFQEQVKSAEYEVEQELGSVKGKILSLLKGDSKYKLQVRQKICPKFYDQERYQKLLKEKAVVDGKIEEINIPVLNEKIIIYCENQNANYFNKLGFSNIHFISEKNSDGVYIKTIANPTHFGLRDRDFLLDSEIEKLKKKYNNYKILEYYCFENYLFHPENLKEIDPKGFVVSDYIKEMIQQKKEKYTRIILNLKNARSGYQEFRIPDNGIRENDELVARYLQSDEVEVFLKSFSLKTEFDKSCLSKYSFSTDQLIRTDWFKKKIELILSF